MTPEQSAHPTHLSEEAINDVLIGLGSPNGEEHLAACSFCRSRVETFQADMQAFNQTSLAWSEALPMPALDKARIAKPGRWIVSPLSWALAAALLIAVGLPLWNTQHRHSPAESANRASDTAASPSNSDAQIAQDNELMRSVDVALNESEDSPVSAYHLSADMHAHVKTQPQLRYQ
jgi:hypothetical protein